MKRVLFIVIFIFILSPIFVNASELELVDTYYPGGILFNAAIESYNENGNTDGYVLFGNNGGGYHIEKRDFNGNIIWSDEGDWNESTGTSVILSYNDLGQIDGYILQETFSASHSNMIHKYDLNGNYVWGKDLYGLIYPTLGTSYYSSQLNFSYNSAGEKDGFFIYKEFPPYKEQ